MASAASTSGAVSGSSGASSRSLNPSSTSGSTLAVSSTASVSIPGTAAAGGVQIIDPPSTAAASYYKIASDEFITFRWNLTSLYVQPQSLTVIASCSANGNTYAVGPTASPSNTLPGNATQVVWNPWQWEQEPGQTPFAEASYVLKIWDERGPGSAVKGGYLSPYAGTQFAMYRPSTYQSIKGGFQWASRQLITDGWRCATCSDAMARFSDPSGLLTVMTLALVVISGWNLVRR